MSRVRFSPPAPISNDIAPTASLPPLGSNVRVVDVVQARHRHTTVQAIIKDLCQSKVGSDGAEGTRMDRTQWEAGIENEVAFWTHWINTKGGEWPDDFDHRCDPHAELTEQLKILLAHVEGT